MQRRERTRLLLGMLAALMVVATLLTLPLFAGGPSPLTSVQAESDWPEWAYKARLAGTFFEPGDSGTQINVRLQALADDNVSVVLLDAPTGWDYKYWENDAKFNQVLDMVTNEIVPRARSKGLKVVWYLTGLELICVGCKGGSTPGSEHPDWMQIDINGQPVDLDADNCTEFWLEPNDVDSWVSPESADYRDLYESRIRDVATSGVDGIWIDVIYLMNSICDYSDLWPSHDEASRVAFQAAYGYATLPSSENWNALKWRQWIHWRYESIRDFIQFVFDAARDEKPDILCFTENWNIDLNYTTWYSQDPVTLMDIPYVSTAHELVSYNQDSGGMNGTSIQNWRDYAFMAKFSVESDNGAPGWILTYARNEDLSRRVAGVMVAEKANFYETKGPGMLNTTAGGRANTFGWIEDSEDYIYDSESIADIAVWYSPESRDYVDRGAIDEDQPGYDYSGTTYMKEFRAREKNLMMAWMPFDIVVDEGLTLSDLQEYEWLVLPDAACLSDDEAQLIRDYANSGGKVAVTMDTGDYNEWYQERSTNALAGITTYNFSAVTSDLLATSLDSTARGQILAEVRYGTEDGTPFLIVPLVNFNVNTTRSNFTADVRLPDGFTVTSARMTTPDGSDQNLSYSIVAGGTKVRVTVPSLDTTDLIIIEDTVAPPTAWLYLPLVLREYAPSEYLLYDNFEDGDADGWTVFRGDWQVETLDTGAYVYQMNSAPDDAGYFSYAGSSSWTDYTVEADLRLVNTGGVDEDNVGLKVRSNNSGQTCYIVQLHANDDYVYLEKIVAGNWTNLGAYETTIDEGVWYTVKVILKGNNIKVYLDGQQISNVNDSSISSGKIGLYCERKSRFDNVKVW